jgi:signal transduction histidine kinase
LISAIFFIAFVIKQNALKKEKQINQLLNQQNEKLIGLNNKKKQIIGIVSHDLSTPFASIDMWNQLLKNSATNWNEDQNRSFDMIGEGVHYGHRLLRKIAELENIIPDKINIDKFDFGAFANAIVENIRSSSDDNIQWDLQITKPLYFLSDMGLIKKMCEALLINAVSNTIENGEINVILKKENDEIYFQIKNQAIEISKNKIPNLFSDYKEIASKKNQSSEISKLAIALRVVEELDGKITSENKDDRAIITIKFRN